MCIHLTSGNVLLKPVRLKEKRESVGVRAGARGARIVLPLCVTSTLCYRAECVAECYSAAHGGHQTYNIFGSPDLSIFLIDPLSDGDSIYSRENWFGILGTPVKTYLICMGTPVKTCWKFWQSKSF